MIKRLQELFFILALVALVVSFQRSRTEKPLQEPPQSATNIPRQTVKLGDAVADFTLLDSNGEIAAFEQGNGPLLITLTATGCQDCLQRIDGVDVTAFEMANKSRVKVWNHLVYHSQSGSSDFALQHKPSADRVLADPTAQVSVKMLGGSDSSCWLLIDGQGRLVYRGAADLDALQQALAQL